MKKIIRSEGAPAPVGPYNQAILFNNTLYISGQIALDPATSQLIEGSIEEETHLVLKNVGAVLEAAGLGYEHVLKCSVFVQDIQDFGRINAVYATYFEEATAPARELVQVAALPKGAHVEISVIAGVPEKA